MKRTLATAFSCCALTLFAAGEQDEIGWDFPGGISVKGRMSFVRAEDELLFVKARDNGLSPRLMIVSQRGEVCGYVMPRQDGSERAFSVHDYGGVAKPLVGAFSWRGEVRCPVDAFPCRMRPVAEDARVVSMATRGADSLLNDAIFLPETDTAIVFAADDTVEIKTLEPGHFAVTLKGRDDGDYAVRVERDWFKHRNIPYYTPIDRKRCPRPPTGWMAWNIYFDDATAKDNLDEARVAARLLKPFGLEFWSIESWQGNSDVLPVAKFHNLDLSCNARQFPQGMKAVADEIRAIGFRPGMWVVPFGTGNEVFYEAHRSWFMHEPDGSPVRAWSGLYNLDPTHPEVLDYVRHMLHVCSYDWGFEFFKIDGMSASWAWASQKSMRPDVHARLARPDAPDYLYAWTRNFREGIGEDRVFLACGSALTASGMADCDATRIGGDIVHPGKPVQWKNILSQARQSVRRLYTHNIVAYNDPDTQMVGDYLSLEEARITTTVVGLPGQVMFAGDKLANLAPERVRLLQMNLPVADIHPTGLYSIEDLLPIWNLAVRTTYGAWNVTALFNWGEDDADLGFDFAELGLRPDVDYAVYETWTESWEGFHRGSFRMKVPRHAVRLLTIHEKSDKPVLLASNRHITQGYEDVLDFRVAPDGRVGLKMKLVANHPVDIRILHPDGKIEKRTVCEPVSGVYEK